MNALPAHLASFLTKNVHMNKEPWVTLTFAQSKDGKIAGPNRQPLRLSGDETMAMTHDGTLLMDDPKLNERSPRPVVLDLNLRTPPTARLLTHANDSSGVKPLVFTAHPMHASELTEWGLRRHNLERAGAQIRLLESDEHGVFTWETIFNQLRQEEITSVMIEGGANVIDSCLAAHSKTPFLNAVIVTVAPAKVGHDGYGYTTPLPLQGGEKSGLYFAEALEVGPDTVVAMHP
ncbi:2,5-diamino-6-(ribosylamino)-4(3H)-pyrimidinone 5'-phosphate reductase [Malassezia vespertilionis]|uniref:2,5-diamino-6-(ribosylamino)-4(3H)-pyrimidinone 5'-phosphate reductase n=1 Tax=Malassezia vespertilionis TaxID=2020962 RepID=UPI0024B0F659|nr:2,5-diamino-6-(ribosylamino)-4(3H)-pyrimidinone 5'-phosphate reductase [Malassezia vespertilionis]WFD06736.1 2,5-diamino-6-(ribosylamino)-4(3H)-pyrimidinone 5'-phosphate reductase [Malassezia vespertilionis]